MITSVGRDAEKGVLLHAAVQNGNAQLLWRQFSSKSKSGGLTMWPSNSMPRAFLTRTENSSHTVLYRSAQRALIFSSQDMVTTQMTTDGQMDKKWFHPSNRMLSSIEKKWSPDNTSAWVTPKSTLARRTRHEGHLSYESIYTKCPEKAKLQKQETEERLQGLGEVEWDWLLTDVGASFWGKESSRRTAWWVLQLYQYTKKPLSCMFLKKNNNK